MCLKHFDRPHFGQPRGKPDKVGLVYGNTPQCALQFTVFDFGLVEENGRPSQLPPRADVPVQNDEPVVEAILAHHFFVRGFER